MHDAYASAFPSLIGHTNRQHGFGLGSGLYRSAQTFRAGRPGGVGVFFEKKRSGSHPGSHQQVALPPTFTPPSLPFKDFAGSVEARFICVCPEGSERVLLRFGGTGGIVARMGMMFKPLVRIGRFCIYRKYPRGFGWAWLPRWF